MKRGCAVLRRDARSAPGSGLSLRSRARARMLGRGYRQDWVFATEPYGRGHMETTMLPADHRPGRAAGGDVHPETHTGHHGWVRAAEGVTAEQVGEAFLVERFFGT
jgi:hypothetical protein